MTKTLIAAGDSFTFGNELSDCNGITPSQLTWSALLSKHIKYNYVCEAFGGFGNVTATRKTIDAVHKLGSQNVAVVVMWTFPSRDEIKLQKKYKSLLKLGSTLVTDQGWLNLSAWDALPVEDKLNNFAKFSEEFKENYKKIYRLDEKTGIFDFMRLREKFVDVDVSSRLKSLQNIFLLQEYLNKKNIPYVFAVSCNQVKTELFDKSITELLPYQDLIDLSKFVNFDQGFQPWAISQGYYITPAGHPLEEAHRDWAELNFEKIKNILDF